MAAQTQPCNCSLWCNGWQERAERMIGLPLTRKVVQDGDQPATIEPARWTQRDEIAPPSCYPTQPTCPDRRLRVSQPQ